MTSLLPDFLTLLAFLIKVLSIYGPFHIDRATLNLLYLVRRRRIKDCVRLLDRVLLPFVGLPHGVTG